MRKNVLKRVSAMLVVASGWVLSQSAVVSSAPLIPPPPLKIQVAPAGWGDAETRDVERLLQNAASHLSRYFPSLRLPAISVSPLGGPIVLHQRGSEGQLIVRLNTRDRYWAQYAFQFGHELCHILSRFDEDPTGNRWFEESLCEAASLFVVRGMGASWATEPPYSNWSPYAPELTKYAAQRIEKFRPAEPFVLSDWYVENADALAAHAENRDLNTVVAVTLLPMFEAAPEHWQALQYLNDGKPAAPQTFAEYLGDWHGNAPEPHKAFILEIARRFGVAILAA